MRASSAASSTAVRAVARAHARPSTIDDLAEPLSLVRAARSAQVPRTNSSCTFVSSRATHAAALGRRVGELARASPRVRFGASKSTTGSGVSQTSAMASRSRAPSRGRKPTKRNRPSPASPLATSAASTALAPGIGTTADPCRDRRPYERLARVAHRRRPRVGHERDVARPPRAARRARATSSPASARARRRPACPRSRGA